MPISDYTRHGWLNALRNVSFAVAAVYVKLHIGDPGSAGTTNPATETTRQLVTFAAASGGAIASNNTPSWTAYPAAETVSHISLWDAATAGNFLWGGALSASKTLANNDQLDLTSLTLSVPTS